MQLRRRILYPVLITLLAMGLLWSAARGIVRALDYADSDFFSFWLAGRMVWTGQDPYSAQEWIAGHHQFGADWISDATFLYPLPLAWLCLPLGLLPLRQAFVLWLFLSQVMVLASLGLLVSACPRGAESATGLPFSYALPLLAGVALFRPLIATLFNGQLGAALLWIVTLIACLWERGRWLAGGCLLPLLALKPNIGAPLLALLGCWLLARRRWRALAGAVVSGLLILGVGWLHDPRWIAEFLSIGSAKFSQTFGYSPTVWGMAAYFCRFERGCTLALGGGGALGLLAASVYLLRVKSPAWAMGWAIPAALLLTPYVWPYDQILLIFPLGWAILEMARAGRYPYLLPASLFLLVDAFALVLYAVSAMIEMENWNAVLPLIVLILAAWRSRITDHTSWIAGHPSSITPG